MRYSVGRAFAVGIEAASRCSGYLGCASISAMALIVTIDVSGRYFFNRPLKGGPELVEQLMVCTIFFMLPYITGAGRHITVDVFLSHMARIAPRTLRVVTVAFDIITLVLLGILAWQGFVGSIDALYSGEATDAFRIRHYPFHIILAVGFSLAFLISLVRFIQGLTGNRQERNHAS